jgi:hypothetical protein
MKYKVVIQLKGNDGDMREESVLLTAQNEQDAEFQRQINQEVAEKKHGQDNVISVILVAL